MISNSNKKGPVKLDKDTGARSWSPKNAYAVDNVNVAQGPRTGTQGLNGKRADFIAAKEAREPLATIINEAYVKRAHEYEEFEYTNGGSIHDNTKAEFNKKSGIKSTAGRK
jgi:hypothetical protein